jgi:hypothetical protein
VWKSWLAIVVSALTSSACLAADLTAIESRWLHGAWPVIVFAREANLPLDIVVQPQASPGAAPLALAFVDGRCKLVLSMRDNEEAMATLERIEPGLLDMTIELMAAHELGHCRRYVDGAWYGVPVGFVASEPDELLPEPRRDYVNMKAARREEGYGDLVGLAWTERHHPQHYAALHAWLAQERRVDLVQGSHHDTLAWVGLARGGVVSADLSIFDSAKRIWESGLSGDE